MMTIFEDNFPQEHLVELRGLSPALVGRIVVYKDKKNLNLEIDIIQSDSGKIYNHVKSLYGEEDLKEALALAVQNLKNFLNSIKQ